MANITIYPDSTISSTNARDQADGTTDLHSPINDATPNDSTYTHTQHTSTDAQVILGLDNLPTDAHDTAPMSTGDNIAYTIRTRHFITRTDDSIELLAQVTSSAGVAYTNQVSIDIYNSGSPTSFANQTGNFTVNATGAAANEAAWNAARIQLDWTYTKDMQADNIDIDISNVALDFTYNQAAAAPVISSPTASATGINTGTGGFSTDTTSGTGYYYISTSATPPSATDLKNGTGAVDSGSSTITASPHTFNFSGLSPSTTYYAHYIQNATSGDSNIVTSASFTTNAEVAGTTTFTNNLSETIAALKDAQTTTLFNTDLSELITNLLTGFADTSLDTNLSEAINRVITTSSDTSLGLNLSTSQTASISIVGNLTLGLNLAKTCSNTAARAAQANADLTISDSVTAARLLNSAVTYSLDLSYDTNTLGLGILDDPIWSLSSGEYIFVDLTNLSLAEGTVKSATLTLTSQLGESYTVNLIGEAATNILLDLATVQTGVATKAATQDLSLQLSKTTSGVADMFRDITFALNISDLNTADTAKLASVLLALQLSEEQTNLKTGVASVDFDENLTFLNTGAADRPVDLTLSSTLSESSLNSLVKHLSVDFSTSLSLVNDIQADLTAAITYLTNLSESFVGETTGVRYADITFGLNVAKTEQVQAILRPVVSFVINTNEPSQARKVTDEAITYLTQVQTNLTNVKTSYGILDLVLNISDEEIAQTGVFAVVDFIVNLAKDNAIQVDYYETLALVLNLAQTCTNLKNTNGLVTLTNNLSTDQLNQLTKVLTISFVNNLSLATTNVANLNAAINIATALSELFVGESLGQKYAFATLSTALSQESLNLKQTFETVDIQTLLDKLSSGARIFSATAQLDLSLDDLATVDLSKEGIANFNTFYTKLSDNSLVGRPSISIDMTLADLSTAHKQTLTQVLLGIQSEISYIGAKEVAGLVTYGLNNGLDVSVSIVAEGQVTLATDYFYTDIAQILGQAGITFGQVLGLASLGGALKDANITIGSILDATTDGFVIQFAVTTPDGRRFKVYLEDRITIVDNEGRVIKIYKDPGSSSTIN